MFRVQTQLYGASMESHFPKAIPFRKAGTDDFAEALLERFAAQGILAEHLSLRKGDELFDYELKFSLFRGSAEFSLNSRRLKMHFSNATQPGDVETISATAVNCLACLTLPGETDHQVTTFAHFTFSSPDEFQSFFTTRGTRWESDFLQLGIVATLADPEWPKAIRATVEHSLLLEGGGFLMLATSFTAPLVGLERLRELERVLQRSTTQLHLQFESP